MLDDLGYGELGSYGGSEIYTPVLDQLASEGLRFTQYYTSAAVCSPTRAAILTGRYPRQVGLTNAYQPPKGGLPAEFPTLPDILRDHGYTTAHVGKWHLGISDSGYGPDDRGYDFSVLRNGAGSNGDFYTDVEYRIIDTRIARDDICYPVENDPCGKTGHITANQVDYAIEFLDEHLAQPSPEPFFLSFWSNVPHTPYSPPTGDDVDAAYRNSYPEYTPQIPNADDALYKREVSDFDYQLGKLVDELDALGVANDTVIVISSDNGGLTHVFPLANAPFQGAKKSLHEGGIRSPLIVHWPGTISARSQYDGVVASIDFLPTLATLAGITPAEIAALELDLDGQDVSDAFLFGTPEPRNGALHWETKERLEAFSTSDPTENRYAVREGPWKLLKQEFLSDCVDFCLFHLDSDSPEARDLSQQNPVRVAKMAALHSAWRQKVGRLPHTIESNADVSITAEIWDFDLWTGGSPDLDGGVAVLEQSSMYNVVEKDFSIRMKLTPTDFSAVGARDQVIAERPGAWELSLDAARYVKFTAHGPLDQYNLLTRASTTVTSLAPLVEGEEVEVVVAIYGWKKTNLTMRLYLKRPGDATNILQDESWGILDIYAGLCTSGDVATLRAGCYFNTHCAVVSGGVCAMDIDDPLADTRVRVGRSADAGSTRAFSGTIEDLEFWTLHLFPEELDPVPPPVPTCDDSNDCDEDGELDLTDNCTEHPNAALLGSCSAGDTDKIGATCTISVECGASGVCSLGQDDADVDGVGDICDNCPSIANAGQEDQDGDWIGDACNSADDSDNDDWADTLDNCPGTFNPSQANSDGVGDGDACNVDSDFDEVDDGAVDYCVGLATPYSQPQWMPLENTDYDADQAGFACDNCPLRQNFAGDFCVAGDSSLLWTLCSSDTDCDGSTGGGVCDFVQSDLDWDGPGDVCDNCPAVANVDQLDSDLDGIGDACASDVDGDSIDDQLDNCPETPNGYLLGTCTLGTAIGTVCSDDPTCGAGGFCSLDQEDTLGDGIGDACNPCWNHGGDTDLDGVCDDTDNCITIPNPEQGPDCPQYEVPALRPWGLAVLAALLIAAFHRQLRACRPKMTS